MSTSAVVLTTLVAYKLVLVGIGLWARSRNRNEADFFLGGRGLGALGGGAFLCGEHLLSLGHPWLLGVRLCHRTKRPLDGARHLGRLRGGVALLWEAAAGGVLAQDQLTLTDFLLQDAAPRQRAPLAALAAALVIGCFVFYIAAQFDAAGKALAEHFALSLAEAVVLGALIVAVYSMLGGYWAVSVTDTLQAVIMMLVAMGVPLAALAAGGGPAAVLSMLAEQMPPAYLQVTGGHSPLVFIGFVIGVVGMSLGALGQPHLLSRLMAIRGERDRLRGFAIVIGWGVVVFLGMIVLAWALPGGR